MSRVSEGGLRSRRQVPFAAAAPLWLVACALAGPPVLPLPPRTLEAQETMGAIDRAALRYREVRAICADFAQVIEVRLMRDTVESAGRICQQRPNLLSMRFTDPDGDMVISDGEYLWAYYPSRNRRQVMRQSVSDSPGREDFFREFLEDPGTKYEAEEGGIEAVE
ncbi:MAG: outer membrane lipoprotein carrier protein LolA, partial [Gemmatimonadetes bacterium]|nr:outer membrane lipoprotein carrier protein LolA [Gemmatimonadota bacterium]